MIKKFGSAATLTITNDKYVIQQYLKIQFKNNILRANESAYIQNTSFRVTISSIIKIINMIQK